MLPFARLFQAAQTLAIVAVALGAAIILGSAMIEAGAGERDEKAAWRRIDGPACATVDHPSPAWTGGPRPLRHFAFGGVDFAHKHGDVYCMMMGPRPACQFLSPGLASVRFDGDLTYYAPPIGRTATLRIGEAGPSCVLGGWLSR